MSETPLAAETLDIQILREMYREGAVNVAGIDPRVNATRIAHRLKVGRGRVAARLRAWDRSGFLRRYDVWLNPALFGWVGTGLNVRVVHPREKAAVIGRLGLLDGVVSCIEYLGEWISLGLVVPDAALIERRIGLIRALAGVAEVDGPFPWHAYPPQRALTPLDVRIVRALRARPRATLGEIADLVGISTRTMTRRYSELLDDVGVWFVPAFDFRAISRPVVSIGMQLRPGTSPEKVVRPVYARYPLTLEFHSPLVGPDLGALHHWLFVLPPTAAHVEEVEQFVRSLEGVEETEAYVLVRMHSFPTWFDQHLETLAPLSRAAR